MMLIGIPWVIVQVVDPSSPAGAAADGFVEPAAAPSHHPLHYHHETYWFKDFELQLGELTLSLSNDILRYQNVKEVTWFRYAGWVIGK